MSSAHRGSTFVARHRVTVGLGAAVVALGMAALWIVVVPAKASTTAGLQSLAIRWGHPACWGLLALTGILFAAGVDRRLVSATGWAALACYASFLVATVL